MSDASPPGERRSTPGGGVTKTRTRYAEYLSPCRLDCCAVVEPAAALLYACDLLTIERRAACEEAGGVASLRRFVPDRYEPERRQVLGISGGRGQ